MRRVGSKRQVHQKRVETRTLKLGPDNASSLRMCFVFRFNVDPQVLTSEVVEM
jgi:hypothetical protein